MLDDIRQWLDRWKLVNAFEMEELRRTSPEVRLRQFFTLLGWADKMNWQTSTPEEIEEVRARWKKLRKAYGGK